MIASTKSYDYVKSAELTAEQFREQYCDQDQSLITDVKLAQLIGDIKISTNPFEATQKAIRYLHLNGQNFSAETILSARKDILSDIQNQQSYIEYASQIVTEINKGKAGKPGSLIPLDEIEDPESYQDPSRNCFQAANYLVDISDLIGSLTFLSHKANTTVTPLWDVNSDFFQAPFNTTINTFNKLVLEFQRMFTSGAITSQHTYRNNIRRAIPLTQIEEEQSLISSQTGSDLRANGYTLVPDTESKFIAERAGTTIATNLNQQLGDNYRLTVWNRTYNPFDPDMNLASQTINDAKVQTSSLNSQNQPVNFETELASKQIKQPVPKEVKQDVVLGNEAITNPLQVYDLPSGTGSIDASLLPPLPGS